MNRVHIITVDVRVYLLSDGHSSQVRSLLILPPSMPVYIARGQQMLRPPIVSQLGITLVEHLALDVFVPSDFWFSVCVCMCVGVWQFLPDWSVWAISRAIRHCL